MADEFLKLPHQEQRDVLTAASRENVAALV